MKTYLYPWLLGIMLTLAAIAPAGAATTVTSLTTTVLPANGTRLAINSLKASTGTPTSYRITSVPGGGTLYVNGTALTAARNLTTTEATQLSFTPSGTVGNYSFTFTASDGSGTSAAATYIITVGQASCGQAAGFDFSSRTTNEVWKAQTNVATSGAVTISTSGYSAGAGTDQFQVENLQNGALSPSLTWYTNYNSRNASESTVTFTFSRALSGFTMVVQDIDSDVSDNVAFTDQVQFDGYTSSTATTPIALAAANFKLGTTNTFSNNNRVTGTANSAANPADNVVVTFPQAITRLTLTYRNTQTISNTPAQQGIGIPSFGWCAQADVQITLTGPARAQAASTVAYTATVLNVSGDPVTTIVPTVQLPTGLSGVTGGTYNSSTGVLTLPTISNLAAGASVAQPIAYTMPTAGAVTATATFAATADDPVSSNNTATLTTAQNRTPVASDVTNSPAILSSTTSQTTIASFNASDPDATTGNTTIVSYTILALPTAAQGTLYVNGTAATVNQVITVPTSATASAPGYQLSFVPNGTFAGSAAFTYRATDDTNTNSNTANYYVPVTAGADLVSTAGGQTSGVEGQSKTYSVTTLNNGPATATSVVPTLTLSSKPAFSTVAVTNGSYDPTTGIVTFNATAALASGASVVNAITLVVAAAPASFTVTAANTSATADPTPANNNGTAAAANIAVAIASIGPAGTASACATPGRDNSPTITASPNTYYPATNQTVAAGATSLSVGAAVGTTPIAAGDLLLVVQMQGADIDATNTDSYGDGVAGGLATGSLNNASFSAGQYEYAVAAGAVPVGGGTVGFTTGLKNGYQNASATTTTGQRRFQVVRIPQYQSLTISGTVAPTAWNGSTGGILALDVTGQLTFASGAKLDASGTGFRGGAGQKLTGTTGLSGTDYRAPAPASGTTTTGAHAMKGEGTAGTPRYVNTGAALLDTGTDGYPNGSAGRGAPGNAGGGGTDAAPASNSQNSGGGGGGNGARGGRGGNSWSSNMAVGGEPGAPFNAPSSSRLVLGGGGGAGVTNDGTGGGPSLGYASSGAAGGGIVLVRTGSVSGAGSILANGASASNAVLADGSGGGGAGGSILLTANNTASLSGLNLIANGGTGGTNTGSGATHGPGGGGGGGIVLTNAAPSSASVASGANGTTAGGVAYGAGAGVAGIANNQISNSIAGSTAGINCSTDVLATITAPTTATQGQTVSLSAVFANNGGADATTVTRTIVLASGDVNNPVTGVVASGGTIGAPDATTGAVTITYPAVSPLAAGTSSAYGISYVAPGTGAVTATAAITTASSEPVTSNNTSTATTTISGYADVVSAVFGLTSSITGRPTGTYSVVFANNGPAAAASVTRTVTLPAGATLTTAQANAIAAQGGSYNSGTQVIDFGMLPTLNSHSASVFQFGYLAPNAGGSYNLVSNITTTTAQDANGDTGTAPDQFTFAITNNAAADLATNGVTASATAVMPGQQGSFTLNFVNNGPGNSAIALRYAQLTPGLSIVSITGGGSYNATTGIITYPAVAVASGGTAPSTVTFVAPATGGINISGSMSGGGSSVSSGVFDNNQATASMVVTPLADVATTLSGPTAAVPGNLVTFAVTTANNGPSPAAAVVQTVQLPTGLTGVFPSNNGTYNANSGVVTYPAVAVLASGTVANNTISFPMPAAGFTASAAVTTATSEGTGATANNAATATATTTLAATSDQANVYNTLTLADQTVAPGTPITLTIVTGNSGPNLALNVVQQLSLPPGLSITSISNSGTYNATTGVVTFPALPSQISGTSVANTLVLTAPTAGPVVAVASVSSTTSDPVPADNVVIRSVDVLNVADVATTLVGPGIAAATQVPTFTVSTLNNGPVPATNVVQTVAIPAGFAPANVTTTGGGVYNPTTGLITWPAVSSLAVGEGRTYTYSYVAPAFQSTDANNPRTIVSVATVAAATPDGVTSNNTTAVATEIKWNADVAIAVAGPGTAIVGNPITFTVSVSNNGPAPAGSVTPTVRIATGLPSVVASGGGVYDSNTGIVTFPTISNQAVGVTGAVTNTITLLVPDRPIIGVAAAANFPTSTNDINLTNNAATLVIPVTPQTSTLVDLQTTITSNLTSQQAGQPIVLTVTAKNASTTTANLRERVTLPAGLSGVVVVGADGSPLPNAYDAASGVVTFPLASGQAAGATLTYTITVNNPGNDPLVATATINGNLSDPTPANNTQTVSVTIVPVADVATTVSGPATMLPNGLATYEVVTINNGPSPAAAVAQTVQLPTGLTGVTASGGGTYDATSGRVTFPNIATEAVGLAGEVTNTVSFIFPTTASTVTATVTSGTNENAATNNTATLTTTLANQVPLASNLSNRLQTPQGNTAAPLTLTALAGLDPDGAVAAFTIATLPAAAAGVLALNGNAVAAGQVVAIADAARLTFAPAASFVGNTFFTYSATDNQGATSALALYTIAIGQDNASVYTSTPVKGAATTVYQDGDVIANAFDSNTGVYDANAAVTDNGVRSATLANGSTLPSGLALDPGTGQVEVADRTLLVAGTYPVSITTIDANGGTNTQVVSLTIGAFPLPVELTQFDAKAAGANALLSWTTAQEIDNAGFGVERSFDGTAFAQVAFVAGAGTSSQPQHYALTDAGVGQQHPGKVYYRLRQLDRNQQASYSAVRTLTFVAAASLPSLSVFPNPALAQATLDLTSLPVATYQVTLVDMTGRQLQAHTLAGGGTYPLDLSSLPSGTYLVIVRNDSLRLTQRLIKQ